MGFVDGMSSAIRAPGAESRIESGLRIGIMIALLHSVFKFRKGDFTVFFHLVER